MLEQAEQVDTKSPEDRAIPAVAWSLAAIGILAFATIAWFVPQFRNLLGSLTRPLAIALYASVAITIAVRAWIVRRSISSPASKGALSRLSPWWLTPAGFAGSVVAYLAVLFGGWGRGRTAVTIAGIIPMVDAALYVGGAERLLFDGELDGYNSRRPLNAYFLATRLAATGLDLRLALVIQAILLGAACFLAAKVVARDLGGAAGLALFVGLFAYSYPMVGNTMSESLGVTFGALAFAALWIAIRDRVVWLAIGGTFLFAIAATVRASTVLLPLVLAIWLAHHLRSSGFLNLRVLGLGLLSLVAAGAVNVAVLLIGGAHVDTFAGNGSYGLYALATGRPLWDVGHRPPNWTAVYDTHRREIHRRTEYERGKYVSTLTRRAFTDNPGRFVEAYARSEANYADHVWQTTAEPIESRTARRLLGAVVLLVTIALFVRRWRTSRRDAVFDFALLVSLVLAVPVLVQTWGDRPLFGVLGMLIVLAGLLAFGVLGSKTIPRAFVHLVLLAFAVIVIELPFVGVDNVRVLATLAPFLVLPLAFTAAILDSRATRRFDQGDGNTPVVPTPAPLRFTPVALGVAIIAAALIGGPIAMAAVTKPAVEARRCPDERRAEAIIGAVSVQLVASDSDEHHVDQVHTKIPPDPALVPFLDVDIQHLYGSGAGVGDTILFGVTDKGDDRLVFLDRSVPAGDRSVTYVCGTVVDNPLLTSLGQLWATPITFRALKGTLAGG